MNVPVTIFTWLIAVLPIGALLVMMVKFQVPALKVQQSPFTLAKQDLLTTLLLTSTHCKRVFRKGEGYDSYNA